MAWGSPVEQERRRRILVAGAAYAYEIENNPVMSDAEYDALAAKINPQLMTGHPAIDEFFLVMFQPYTGAWVRQHPDLEGVRRTCRKMRASK